ncbi:hypothetical protein FRE64_01085 [Euhalothece natronophila Z-M001]|uniref:Calcium-binding protein n=1 Tax=Euhalothece natronophila Z-M001 TaxID=522448 RepID=A0A5B8NI61_9CHRO|nr:hypothetical protein [Euhalothece natronophila]QDZ38658.1 hypothetical protein FRE64_01085 [Euhalothece natronophila Z-M001]
MVLTREQAQRFFDEDYYLNNNEDVRDAVNDGVVASGLTHFLQNGVAEGRAPNSLLNDFAPEDYLDAYPDVADAIDDGFIDSALEHFLAFGAAEGRLAGTGFDFFSSSSYLSANPDVANAVNEGVFNSALEHWINFGFAENRPGVEEGVGGDFMLTRGSDNLTGTSGDDVFVAPLEQDGGTVFNTFESGDVLDGRGGNNILEADLTDTAGAPSISSITDNIQEIYIRSQFQNTDAADNLLFEALQDSFDIDIETELGANGSFPVISDIDFSFIGGLQFLEADDLFSQGTNIDAENNSGVEQWWSENSRADLLIEDIRERSDDVTFGMRDTDPGVSYAAFFDPASLAADATDSSLTLTLEDVENPDSLENFPVNGLTFLLDGEEFEIRVPREDEDGNPINSSYDDFVAALNEELEATEGLENVQASLNPDNTITLTDGEGRTFEEDSFLFIDDQVPSRGTLTFNQEVGAPIEGDIATNIVLDGAGRTEEGGVMVVGSMGARGGIQEFDVEVGNTSWLQALSSTNNTLETVNVESNGSGALYLGLGERDGDDDITGDVGFSVPETVDDRLAQSGLVDVQTFNAAGFENELKLGAQLTAESIDKYLADAEEPVTFEYLLGDGGSNLNLGISPTLSLDPDFELEIVGGAQDDRINLSDATVKENISIDGGDGENTLEVNTDTDPNTVPGSNFNEVENIQRFVIAGNNFDPGPQTNQTSQNIEEGNLSGLEEIIIATEAFFDTTGDGNPNTFLPADTTVSQFEADTDIIISGKNQTIGSGNSNDDQDFGTIAIEDAPESELELILDNTARVNGELFVAELDLEEDDNVETLELVSDGRRDTENSVLNAVLPNVTTLELVGSQDFNIHVSSMAENDEPLEIDGSELGEEDDEGDFQPATLTLALNAELLTEGNDDTLTGGEGEDDSLILYGNPEDDVNPDVSDFESVQFGLRLDRDEDLAEETPFQGADQAEFSGTYDASGFGAFYDIQNLDGDLRLEGLPDGVTVRIYAPDADVFTDVTNIELIADGENDNIDITFVDDTGINRGNNPEGTGWGNLEEPDGSGGFQPILDDNNQPVQNNILTIQDYSDIEIELDSGGSPYQYLFQLELLDGEGEARFDNTTPNNDFDADEFLPDVLTITGGDSGLNGGDRLILANAADRSADQESTLDPALNTIDISGFGGNFASGFNTADADGDDTTIIGNEYNLFFELPGGDDFNTRFVFEEDAASESTIWVINNFRAIDDGDVTVDDVTELDLTAFGINNTFTGIDVTPFGDRTLSDTDSDFDPNALNDPDDIDTSDFDAAFPELIEQLGFDDLADFITDGANDGVVIDSTEGLDFQIVLPGVDEGDLGTDNIV